LTIDLQQVVEKLNALEIAVIGKSENEAANFWQWSLSKCVSQLMRPRVSIMFAES